MNFLTPKLALFVIVSLFLASCNPIEDRIFFEKINESKQVYTKIELEIIELVNNHRASIGLHKLEITNIVSSVAYDHTIYMVSTGKVSHDNFARRNELLVSNVGAFNVGENVAFGYNSAEGAVNAWLKSEVHKNVIENEDYTHFGISTEKNDQDKNFFTQIFIKK